MFPAETTAFGEFVNLTAPDQQGLASLQRFAPGEILHSPFEDPALFGLVRSGFVKAYTRVRDRSYVCGLLFEDDLIQSEKAESEIYYQALTTVWVYCLEYRAVTELRRSEPKIDGLFLKLTSQELRRSREWIGLLGRRSVEERVAAFLVMLARRSSAELEGDCVVEVPMKRGEIAEFLGTTIESVSRAVSALRSERVLRLKDLRHLQILDFPRLSGLAGL